MGQRIKDLRDRRGMTQEGVARAAGVTLGAVRKWEKGTRAPSFEMAIRLARALGCTLDELAGIANPEKGGGK
jgi:transcriptional regulator with XRE-family HTH domain